MTRAPNQPTICRPQSGMSGRFVATVISIILLTTACSAEAEPQLTEAYQVRLDAETTAAEAEAERQELAAQLEQAEADTQAVVAQAEADTQAVLERQAEEERQRAEDAIEAAIEADYLAMASVVTSRVNELSLIDLDQECLAAGFRTAELPLVTDPGRPFAEFDATRVSLVMVECGALDSYMKNLNQLGLGPTLTEQERTCLGDYVGEMAGSDFQLLLAAELMGEAGVFESNARLDDVYSTTWDAAENCNIEL